MPVHLIWCLFGENPYAYESLYDPEGTLIFAEMQPRLFQRHLRARYRLNTKRIVDALLDRSQYLQALAKEEANKPEEALASYMETSLETVKRNKALTASQRLVLSHLSGEPVSISELSRLAARSRITVRRALADLEAQGLARKEGRKWVSGDEAPESD